jgi:hypothetical protein
MWLPWAVVDIGWVIYKSEEGDRAPVPASREASMKFMATWRIAPENQRAAAERFLAGGASVAEGVTLLGRWHAPGSATGFALCEADELGPVAAHLAEWGNLLELTVTPVLEDEAAGAAIAQGIAAGG